MTKYLDISGISATWECKYGLDILRKLIGDFREPLIWTASSHAYECDYYSAMDHSHIITYALTLPKDR